MPGPHCPVAQSQLWKRQRQLEEEDAFQREDDANLLQAQADGRARCARVLVALLWSEAAGDVGVEEIHDVPDAARGR